MNRVTLSYRYLIKSCLIDSLTLHFDNVSYYRIFGTFLSYTSYEALKNAGFDIISEESLRNEILNLFGETYSSTFKVLEGHEDSDDIAKRIIRENFFSKEEFGLIPYDFDNLLDDPYYRDLVYEINDSGHGFTVSFLNAS